MTIKVLYMHGLESGPYGYKSRTISNMRNISIYAADMEAAVLRLDKQNSIVRRLFQQPSVQFASACAMLSVLSLFEKISVSNVSIVLIPTCIIIWIATIINSFAAAVRAMIDGCLQIQRCAINTYQPDIVVGSSLGGCIAWMCMMEGTWKGPTILLAPAISRCAVFGNLPLSSLFVIPRKVTSRCVIFHGTNDSIIPLADSLKLSNATGVSIKVISNGDHRLHNVIESNDFYQTILKLTCNGDAAA